MEGRNLVVQHTNTLSPFFVSDFYRSTMVSFVSQQSIRLGKFSANHSQTCHTTSMACRTFSFRWNRC